MVGAGKLISQLIAPGPPDVTLPASIHPLVSHRIADRTLSSSSRPLGQKHHGCVQQDPAQAGRGGDSDEPHREEVHGVLQLRVQFQDLPVGVLSAAGVLDDVIGHAALFVQRHLRGHALLGLLLGQAVPLHQARELSGGVTEKGTDSGGYFWCRDKK